MFRLLTIAVVFHWAAIFSMLAFMCVLAGSDGAAQALSLIGFGEVIDPARTLPPAALAALAAILFALCGVLFWWALVTVLLGEESAHAPADILSLAFASSVGTLSAVFLYGAAQGLNGLFPTIAVHVAALLVSYTAINAERRVSAPRRDVKEAAKRSGLRQRANEAAQVASLARFSGRPPVMTGEGR